MILPGLPNLGTLDYERGMHCWMTGCPTHQEGRIAFSDDPEDDLGLCKDCIEKLREES